LNINVRITQGILICQTILGTSHRLLKAKLNLYGNQEARPGRKMGHCCYLHKDVDAAILGREHC
jgi:phosphoribosylaminoimidazole carboxylase (NCAIR synthetase)